MVFKRMIVWSSVVLVMSTMLSCSEDADPVGSTAKDNFDRQALLTFTADEIILPAFSNYQAACADFDVKVQSFVQNPDANGLSEAQAAFRNAYFNWQEVSIFQVGPAEARSLLNFTNIYPCDTADLEEALDNPSQDLSLPSTFDVQGWPAIDFLLFGLSRDVLSSYQSETKYGLYLQKLSNRLLSLAAACKDEWQGSYRNEYISNDGYGATASFNKLANDFVFHFEKELRAGKVGIPAGVFSGSALANRVEAYYIDTLSKGLFLHSLQMHRKLLLGESLDGSQTGLGLKAYLDELNIRRDGALLSDVILNQLELARNKALVLDPSFAQQIADDNIAMLSLYDELQKVVPWIKVDMLQAFNVNVDYIDADGD